MRTPSTVGQGSYIYDKGATYASYCKTWVKVLFNGLNGEIYNVANENSIASIAEVASICAEIAGTKVVFDLPDKIEKKGFSQSKDCILDNSKLKSLGWNGKYTLKQGLVETIESLREDK